MHLVRLFSRSSAFNGSPLFTTHQIRVWNIAGKRTIRASYVDFDDSRPSEQIEEDGDEVFWDFFEYETGSHQTLASESADAPDFGGAADNNSDQAENVSAVLEDNESDSELASNPTPPPATPPASNPLILSTRTRTKAPVDYAGLHRAPGNYVGSSGDRSAKRVGFAARACKVTMHLPPPVLSNVYEALRGPDKDK